MKILSNQEYNDAISSMNEANQAMKELVKKYKKLEVELKEAKEQQDLIHDLFNKPTIELKPLEDLWRKENPRDKFTIPDRTAFYKWIRLKIIPEASHTGGQAGN